MEFVESGTNRGKDLMIKDGQKFRKVYVFTDGRISWRCTNRTCNAKIVTYSDFTLVSETRVHNHEINDRGILLQKIRASCKRKAVAEIHEPPRNVIHEALDENYLKSSSALRFHDTKLLRDCVYRKRRSLKEKTARVVQRPQRSTSKILDTPLSEESCHSELHIGEAHPFSVQDESPASLQGASSSVDVTTASVHGTSFSQSLPISHPNGRGDSSTFVDGSELPQCHSKHSRNEDVIENKNYIDGVFQKLNDISEKFNLLPQTEDSFDHFGRYVASRLRSISSQNAIILQKKIIDFILESHMETVQDNQRVEKSVNEISETVLSEITNNSGSHLEDNDSITIEIESLHDSPSLMDMTSSVTHVPPHSPLMTTTLPTKSINMSGTTNIRASGPKSQSRDRRKCEAFVGASESSEYQNKNSRSDDFMQHEYIDGVLQKLNEMSVKFSLFPQREDGLDYFGRYVVSLLRSLPPQRAFFIQKKIIDLIFLEQYVVL